MRFVLCALVVAITMTLASAAQADTQDHYGGTSSVQQYRMKQLIYRYFGMGYTGITMVCIARRESGLNPRAANWGDSNGGSFGLFQINGVHRHRYPSGKKESIRSFYARMSNPIQNIQSALALYRSSGLSPWGGGC